MDPPDPDLATHLVVLATPDHEAQARDGSMLHAPGTPRAYLGIVERSGQVEVDQETQRVISDDGYSVTVFSLDDPAILTQDVVSWAKIPPGFPLPPPGTLGPVTLPQGWAAEKTGYAIADASAVDYGCWATDATARA